MAIGSYNESKNRQVGLWHLFLPSGYGLISEAIVAMLALVVFNASSLSSQLLSKSLDTTDPLLLWSRLIRQFLDSLGQHYFIEQFFLFGLWAFAGVLFYILVFRITQIVFGVRRSVGVGMQFFREDPDRGIFRWLASLHDFFFALLIDVLGTAALGMGAILSFGIASQELDKGLSETFPNSVLLLFIGFLAAVLSVRLVVFGISLLSRRFRSWYTT